MDNIQLIETFESDIWILCFKIKKATPTTSHHFTLIKIKLVINKIIQSQVGKSELFFFFFFFVANLGKFELITSSIYIYIYIYKTHQRPQLGMLHMVDFASSSKSKLQNQPMLVVNLSTPMSLQTCKSPYQMALILIYNIYVKKIHWNKLITARIITSQF